MENRLNEIAHFERAFLCLFCATSKRGIITARPNLSQVKLSLSKRSSISITATSGVKSKPGGHSPIPKDDELLDEFPEGNAAGVLLDEAVDSSELTAVELLLSLIASPSQAAKLTKIPDTINN